MCTNLLKVRVRVRVRVSSITDSSLIPRLCAILASFPGPAQLSVVCSTEKQFIHAWGEPGNEASLILQVIKHWRQTGLGIRQSWYSMLASSRPKTQEKSLVTLAKFLVCAESA